MAWDHPEFGIDALPEDGGNKRYRFEHQGGDVTFASDTVVAQTFTAETPLWVYPRDFEALRSNRFSIQALPVGDARRSNVVEGTIMPPKPEIIRVAKDTEGTNFAAVYYKYHETSGTDYVEEVVTYDTKPIITEVTVHRCFVTLAEDCTGTTGWEAASNHTLGTPGRILDRERDPPTNRETMRYRIKFLNVMGSDKAEWSEPSAEHQVADLTEPAITVTNPESQATDSATRSFSAVDLDGEGLTNWKVLVQTSSTCAATPPSNARTYQEGQPEVVREPTLEGSYVCFWSTDTVTADGTGGNVAVKRSNQILNMDQSAPSLVPEFTDQSAPAMSRTFTLRSHRNVDATTLKYFIKAADTNGGPRLRDQHAQQCG